MTFSQYGNLFIVIVLTLLLAPAIIMNLIGQKTKYWGMLLTIPMILLFIGIHNNDLYILIVFITCQIILLYGFYYIYRYFKKNWIYIAAIALSILPVAIIKLSVYSSVSLGFLGVSYISFRFWQLIIEIKDEHITKLHLLDVLYFVLFFPTLSSGPIDRYHRFLDDINQVIPRKEYITNYLAFGLRRIGLGMVYKFGFAFIINQYIITGLLGSHTFTNTIIYMYAYTLYLFFDFAGYSHFAIGTSYILGIKVGENFDKPFLSHNMKEFWERWHISLSQWFGDYIYKRFVLNIIRTQKIKSKKTASRAGNILTMLVMGIWHGPQLFYILYGVYHGIMLVLTDIFLKSKLYRRYKQNPLYDITSRLICFHFIAFGMLLFSGYLIKI